MMTGKIDPVTLTVVLNKLDTITREMGIIMTRSSQTPIFSESHDFSCFLSDDQGRLISQADGIPIHTGGGGFAVRAVLEYWGDDINPGDVFLSNDPYVAGGNHLPDWVVFRPVFSGDRLLAFACNRAHQVDIGGGAPGTYNVLATEIFHEGLRLPPVKLYERGRMRRDLLDLIRTNTRRPEAVVGDLGTMIGSTLVGARRIEVLCTDYGEVGLRRYFGALLDYSEQRMRHAIETIPDGTYSASESMNNDCFSEREVPINVTLRKIGSDIEVDFTGTSPQIAAFKNSSLANTHSAVYVAVSTLFDPEIPHNEGSYRMISVVAPEGSLVNPRPPAPVTYCTVYPAHEIIHCVWKALAQVLPARVSAGWGKAANPISVCRNEPLYHWHCLPAAGAIDGRDGFEQFGLLPTLGGLVIANVEVYEQCYPVEFDRWELRVDGGGPGKYRGGTGAECVVRILEPATHILRAEGLRTPSGFGICGGMDGKAGTNELAEAGAELRPAPPYGIIRTAPCQMRLCSAGGGGWGDPLERDPDAVRDDVRDGLVSTESARRDYGVILAGPEMKVDPDATVQLRMRMRSKRK
jgi:N-methylhydantoinase B